MGYQLHKKLLRIKRTIKKEQESLKDFMDDINSQISEIQSSLSPLSSLANNLTDCYLDTQINREEPSYIFSFKTLTDVEFEIYETIFKTEIMGTDTIDIQTLLYSIRDDLDEDIASEIPFANLSSESEILFYHIFLDLAGQKILYHEPEDQHTKEFIEGLVEIFHSFGEVLYTYFE